MSQQKLNRTALLCLGLNILFAIVAIAIGITYFVQKKSGALNSYEAFSDIMTEDEFEQWQKKKT